jgi:translocation and assembly module TamB
LQDFRACLDAQFRSSEDGAIRIPKLSYGGKGFALDGSAQLDPNQQILNLDLLYNGETGAEPWPGMLAAGDLAVKGVLSREGALSRLNATTGMLRVNDIAFEGAELTAEGPPGAIRLKLVSNAIETNATGAITDVSASGQLDARAAPALSLNAFSAFIRNNHAQLTEPAHFGFADGADIRNLRLSYGADGAIALDGRFTSERWRADVSLSSVNIPDADGQISATLSLDTDAPVPARGEFTLRSLLLSEDEQGTIHGRAVWNGDSLRLTNREDGALEMDIKLPVKLVKAPRLTIDTSGTLSGRAKYTGDVQTIAAYMPPVMQSLEGDLTANFALAGTLAKPDFSGGAAIANGAYTEIESGFSLAGLHAEAQASYGGASSTLTFNGGARGAKQTREDTLTFFGDVKFGEASNVNFTAKLDQAEFSAHPINQVRASGELTITGPLDALAAKGDIAIAELDAEIVTPESTGLVEIDVIALNEAKNEPETFDAPRQSGLDYSVRLHAANRVFIRGRGLDSEWSADVTAVNGRETPLILGVLKVRRGWLDFSGRRFDLTRGEISFDRVENNNPRLDLRAEHETSDGVTAIIAITGRALEPEVELTSTPVLPPEDVMSLILFGKPAQTLSPFESLQTAEALASLSGVGPFGGEGVTGRLRRSVGLDLLNIDIDPENGGGSLTVGKYVSKDVFVSATQDAQGRSGAVRVKYEITGNITVETEIEQEGDQTVSANWKKDF